MIHNHENHPATGKANDNNGQDMKMRNHSQANSAFKARDNACRLR